MCVLVTLAVWAKRGFPVLENACQCNNQSLLRHFPKHIMQWMHGIQTILALFCFVASICVSAIPEWYSRVDNDLGFKGNFGLWRQCGGPLGCVPFGGSKLSDRWMTTLYICQAMSILACLSSCGSLMTLTRHRWRPYVRLWAAAALLLELCSMLLVEFRIKNGIAEFSSSIQRGPCFNLAIVCVVALLTLFFISFRTLDVLEEPDQNENYTRVPCFPRYRTRLRRHLDLLLPLVSSILLTCSSFMVGWKHVVVGSQQNSALDFGLWSFCDRGLQQHECCLLQVCYAGADETLSLNAAQATSVISFSSALLAFLLAGYNRRTQINSFVIPCSIVLSLASAVVTLVLFMVPLKELIDDLAWYGQPLSVHYGPSFYLNISSMVVLVLSLLSSLFCVDKIVDPELTEGLLQTTQINV